MKHWFWFVAIFALASSTLAKEKPFELKVQESHALAVRAAAFSPDGEWMLTGGNDRRLKLWTNEGLLLWTQVEQAPVRALAFLPDGKSFLSATATGYVYLWSREGRPQRTVLFQPGLSAFARSPTGKFWATGSDQGEINLFDPNGKLVRQLCKLSGSINQLAFLPDESGLAFASGTLLKGRGNLAGLCLLDGTQRFVLPDQADIIQSVAVRPDGQQLAFGTGDRILVTDPTGKIQQTIIAPDPPEGGYFVNVWQLAYTKDGHSLAIASGDRLVIGRFSFFDFEKSQLRPVQQYPNDVNSVVFSPDGERMLAVIGKDLGGTGTKPQIDLYNGSGRFIRHIGSLPNTPVETVRFSKAGARFAAGLSNGRLLLFNNDLSLQASNQDASLRISALSFSPDGARLATGSWDKNLRLYDGKLRSITSIPLDGYVMALAHSPDGRMLAASAGGNPLANNSVLLLTSEGKKIASIPTGKGWVENLVFTPDSRLLIFDDQQGELRLVRTDGTLEKSIPVGTTSSNTNLSIVQNGGLLVGGFGRTIRFYNLKGELEAETSNSALVQSIAFSPDERYLFAGVGNPDGTGEHALKVWDSEVDDQLGFALDSYTDSLVTSLEVRPDGKLLLAGFSDGTLRLYPLTGNLHQNISPVRLLSDGTDWVAWSEDGTFDGSREAGRLVAIVQGSVAYGVDQFAVQLNRPDLLLGRLQHPDTVQIEHFKQQASKRLRRLNLKEARVTDWHVPQARIDKLTQQDKQAVLSLSCADNKLTLSRYNLYVNDVPVYGAQGKPLKDKTFRVTETLELSPGTNKIELGCVNNAGYESFRALRLVEWKGSTQPDLYLVAFGVSKYQDSSLDLAYAHKDAEDMGHAFSQLLSHPFRQVRVKVLTNQAVSKDAIPQAKAFLAQSRPEDTVVLFIAGHGIHDSDTDATYYYLTHQADVTRLAETAAPFDRIEDLLQGIGSRQKLFLLDTCESGELDPGEEAAVVAAAETQGFKARAVRGLAIKKKTSSQPTRAYLLDRNRYIYNDLARRSGAIVFSSSRGGEYSYEDDRLQNGFFTREILEALSSPAADANTDGVVSVAELQAFVSQAVAKLSQERQHPTVDRDNLFVQFGFQLIGVKP